MHLRTQRGGCDGQRQAADRRVPSCGGQLAQSRAARAARAALSSASLPGPRARAAAQILYAAGQTERGRRQFHEVLQWNTQ